MKLFSKAHVVGIFRGFSEGGLEFHADLILPYRSNFQSTPMHGQFILVQLEHEDEGVLGRITSIASQGRLASGSGEDYGIRAVAEDRPIPEDLREQYLKYQVDIRVLGVIRIVDQKVVFAASHRRLPHVGSKVAFLSDELIKEVAGHNLEGAELGFLAFGEFVYSGDDPRLIKEPWMQVKGPSVMPKFLASHLVSRRSFVFARAGFGKSNLVKLLFSNLYKTTPMIEKRGGKKVPVGTIIFDPDGEYFWPDDNNRPGLCDVPELENQIVVFTKKKGPSKFYNSFVAGDIRLDIRRLKPSDVISIALSPEKQDQQNIRKLKGLSDRNWKELIDLVYKDKNGADLHKIRELLNLEDGQDAEALAARANMTAVVSMLHDPSSQMMDMLFAALKEGKICVVDVSQMRGQPALILSGLILQRIFDYNQEEFTKADSATIPTIAVVEEAQSVLGGSGTSGGEGPYVVWVKEGRKYDLGALLITQQPGSISNEILSQGDNWFIFHLLSGGDLSSVKKANAHFSDDLLSTLLNEPIPGHGIFWSSVKGKSYPIPLRVLSFEQGHRPIDSEYNKPGADTYALKLGQKFRSIVEEARKVTVGTSASFNNQSKGTQSSQDPDIEQEEQIDAMEIIFSSVVARFKLDTTTINKIKSSGLPWRGVLEKIKELLPPELENRDDEAHKLVPRVMEEIFPNDWGTERRESKSGSGFTTWVIKKTGK